MKNAFTLTVLAVCVSLCGTETYAAVGRTVGHFGVSKAGSAQYSIPIWAPPGPRGIQPQISLIYDSTSGVGPEGIGWSLGGLGAVVRCNLTWAQDTTPAAVALATSDGYCLNGKRLRLTGGTYGAAGSTYQTEIADFSQITAVGNTTNGGVDTGPESFTVQGRNGLTYYYGYTDSNGNGANSQVLATGTTTVDYWLLSKVVDRAGNNYVINYTLLTGTAVPNDILWTPTTAGGSTYAYKMLFSYTSNVPQSSLTKYVGGTSVSNTDLLSSIAISYSGSVVKDYFLGYSASSTTGRYELTSVTECPNTTESTSNCLSPTSITYQSGALGVSTGTPTTALSSSGTNLTARYDLNGDGYPDLVYYNGTSWYVSFGSATGYGTPVNTGITVSSNAFFLGNLNGGTKDGILADNGGTWWYYTWNGSSFTGVSTGLAYDSAAWQYQLADVNGDGLPDLVALYLTQSGDTYVCTVDVWLNTGAGGAVSFGARNTWYTTDALSAQLQTPDMQYGKLRRFDFNGDGRDDLVLVTINGAAPNYTEYTDELISTGTAFNATPISSASTNVYVPVFFTDWNDDACTDFVTGQTSQTLYISGCNGTVATSYNLGSPVVAAMDWDGDGRTDLVVEDGSTLKVYLSTGGAPGTLLSTSIPYSSTCQYVTMDANGDGLDDLGCWSETSPNPLTYRLHNAPGQPPDLVSSIADGYGNSASPTYVSLVQSNYAPNTDATYPYEDYIGPVYVVSEVVFSDPSTIDGTYNFQYYYYYAWTNLQGRGFAGFWERRWLDSRNGMYYYKFYEQTFPWTGMKFKDFLDNGSFLPIESVGTPNTLTQATLSSTANQERYFPYFTNLTTTQYEVGGAENGDLITTASTNFTYDGYGNATTIATTVTDNDPNSPYTGDTWTNNATNSPDVDTTHWCLNLFTQTQVAYSASVGGSVTRTKTFTPDTTNCRYTQAITEPTANSGNYKVTEALTFDDFGNIATDTVTGANMPSSPASRETQLNWGTTGQFLNTLTDPSGATTTWAYSSDQALTFGVPDSIKNANNLTTSWDYDVFGRKTQETRPDGTYTTWIYYSCGSFIGCVMGSNGTNVLHDVYSTGGTAQSYGISFGDAIGRPLVQLQTTISGSYSRNELRYDSLGRVSERAFPCTYSSLATTCTYWATNTYDELNRLTESERPISSTNSDLQSMDYAYAGRTTTVTDPYGYTKTIVTDVNGWLRQTKDAIGYKITRAFDSAGSLIGVTDSVGNTLLSNVTVVYGIKPFVTASTDADRGAWIYKLDSLGERYNWTDANNNSFSMTYDALSRPLTRTEPITSTDPGLFTQWQYGSTPASDNVGQLISECTATGNPTSCGSSPQYSETRAFDSYGRLSTRSIKEAGVTGNDTGGVFLYTLGYSTTTGLLDSLTYPKSTSGTGDPLTLQYGYSYGLLTSVTDSSDSTSTCGTTCTLWTANATDAFGHVTQETLGNGVVTNRTFDAVTSWLTEATAGVGGGSALLNQSYLQDENGNVIQRQNNNLGLTESFSYDEDYRLTCTALSSTCSTPTIVYDGGSAGPGNITTQTGVGTYTYPAAGQPRPHAVTSITGTVNGITNPTFSYDANGNMTARASSTANIAWSSYNYPLSISGSDATGTEEVAFTYGPARQRVEQMYTGPSGTEQTYYVGNRLEVVFNGTTNYRHYIYAGREPIAIYSRTSAGGVAMSYMLEDHQGGVSAITSNAGAANADDSFSAFGQLRNSQTWSGAPTSLELNALFDYTRQGYTFQTWLGQSMGLNHMNGRVEDSILGRFLSPDSHIPDRTNAQSYNRYSYVNNNPLTMVDPTGFAGHGNCPLPTCVFDLEFGGSEGGGGISGDVDNDFGSGGGGGTDAIDSWFADFNAAENDVFNDAIGDSGSDGGSDGGSNGGSIGGSDTPDSGSTASAPSTSAASPSGATATGSAQSQTCASCGTAYDPNNVLAGITVTAQSTANQSSYSSAFDPNFFINVANTGIGPVHLTAVGYAHIVSNHMMGRTGKGNYLPQYFSFGAIQNIVGYTISNGTPFTFASGEMGYVADLSGYLSGPVGTDPSGFSTVYNTVQVSLPGVDPNYPNERIVLTSYPGQPGNWGL
jgi:RHS repeat-associated protein